MKRLGISSVMFAMLIVAIGPLGGASAVVGPTDLAMTKSDSNDPVTKGSEFTYTVRVDNIGAADASNVVVTDNLPSEVVFKSATASSGTCSEAGGVVTCNLGQVNAGSNAVVTILVEAKKQGTATNSATVTSPDDTNGANNTDTETTQIIASTTVGKGKGKKVKASCATPTIVGTPGNDTILGTPAGDIITSLTGNDQVFGLGGNDILCLGPNADSGAGGAGLDAVIGGLGADLLSGNNSADLLKGNRGRDRLRGGFGRDALNGGLNRDRCLGGGGRDTTARCP